MMTSYIRIGGVAVEPPAGWREMIGKFLKMMPSRVDEYEALLTENRIWQGRLQGVGKIRLEDAIAYSMSGPTLRAAGLTHDNRKAFPYSSYEEFDFNVPTRTDSDCYGRYLLRVAEIRESLKIVKQADGQDYRYRADPNGSARYCSSAARKDEDGDGSAHLPLQDFHRRFFAAARGRIRGDRVAARRTRLLHRERWLTKAAALPLPHAVVCEPAGAAAFDSGAADCRRDCVHRHH
jgi:hypothetical protein